MKLELNRGAVSLPESDLGTRDPKTIADDIFDIILAEFEWSSEYRTLGANSRTSSGLSTPRRRTNGASDSAGNRGARPR